MKKKSEKVLLAIAFIVIGLTVAGGIYALLTTKENSALQMTAAITAITTPALPSPSVVKTTEATIISVGDIFLHQSNLDSALEPDKKTYNFNDAFSEVADYFQKADLSTAWLGGVMDKKGPYSGYPSFRSPAELVETLQNIGMDVVFRTNHTMDYGTKGLEKTSQILKENNISQVAAAATEEESKNIFIYEKDNLKIAFLGYTYGMNGLPIPKPWMINLIDLPKIKSDVEKAKEKSDFVVVALHFGTEYERFANKWQKGVAQQIADFGADMIIGSHPHVLHPTDMITAADGRKVFVAYGLGNFFCGQRKPYTDSGMILRYTIEKTEEGTKLKEAKYIPTWVAKYTEKGKIKFKILPSKEYLKLYEEGKAEFLSAENYKRLGETYQETLEHMDNPEIEFTEYEQ